MDERTISVRSIQATLTKMHHRHPEQAATYHMVAMQLAKDAAPDNWPGLYWLLTPTHIPMRDVHAAEIRAARES